MHEYAVTESILGIVLDEAAKAGASSVEAVTVVLGELSTIVDKSIGFYFEALSRGTIAEGASLVFDRVQASALCLDCGNCFRPRHAFFACPGCGSLAFQLEAGQEAYVESIEAT